MSSFSFQGMQSCQIADEQTKQALSEARWPHDGGRGHRCVVLYCCACSPHTYDLTDDRTPKYIKFCCSCASDGRDVAYTLGTNSAIQNTAKC